MSKIKEQTKQFISSVLDQEYAKAQEQLQQIVSEKVKERIRQVSKGTK